jgi:hypothetical protein
MSMSQLTLIEPVYNYTFPIATKCGRSALILLDFRVAGANLFPIISCHFGVFYLILDTFLMDGMNVSPIRCRSIRMVILSLYFTYWVSAMSYCWQGTLKARARLLLR